VVGTLEFMPPEQAGSAAQPVDERADVFSLGAMLCVVLTGEPVYIGIDRAEVWGKVRRGDLTEAVARLDACGADAELVQLCQECLAPRREDRPGNAGAVAARLRGYQAAVQARQAEVQERLRQAELERAAAAARAEEEARTRRVAEAKAAVERRARRLTLGLTAALALVAVCGFGLGAWATYERIHGAEVEAAAAVGQKKRAEAVAQAETEKSERLRAETLPLIERAATLRAQGFHQAAALYLAKALPDNDDSRIRAQWLEDMQRSLVPVETSSRGIWTGALSYSPDGRFLVSGGFTDGQIRVWPTDTWQQQLVLPGHPPPHLDDVEELPRFVVREIVFRPDRPNEIISVGKDGAIRLWDIVTGAKLSQNLREGDTANTPLQALAIEPDPNPIAGRRIVTGDSKGNLAWWKLDGLEKIKEVPAAHAGRVNRVRYRPDGRQCASSGEDGVVRLWDPEGKPLSSLEWPERKRQLLQLSATGLHVGAAFAGAPLGPLHVLPFLHLKAEDLPLQLFLPALAYSPDGRQLAAAGPEGRIYVWDVAGQKLLHDLGGHEPDANGDRFIITLAYVSPDRLLSGGTDGTIREWDTQAGKQVAVRGRHEANTKGTAQVLTVVVRPDGREFASSGLDTDIRIWEAQTGKPLAHLEGGPLPSREDLPFSLGTSAFCAKRHLLITTNGYADASLRSWDTRTLRQQRTYTGLSPLTGKHASYSHNRISALAIHPDGSQFVSSEPDGHLIWWDTDTGKQLARSEKAHKPPDPKKLADLARKNSAWIEGNGFLGVGEFVEQCEKGHYSWLAVTALGWSHDGKRVASAGSDGTLKLWNAEAQDRSLLRQWNEEEPEEPPSNDRGIVKEVKEKKKENRLLTAVSSTTDRPQTVLLFDGADEDLITAGSDNVIRFWKLDGDTPRVVEWLRGHARRVNAAALSPDGKMLASGSEDGFVLIWDLGKPRHLLQMIHLKPLRGPGPLRPPARLTENQLILKEAQVNESYAVVRSLAFSPDRRWLAVVLQDGSISLVDVTSGAVTYRGIGHETDGVGKSAITAYFTREGELVTVGGDNSVRHWDLPAWSTGRQVLGPMAEMLPVSRSFDPTGCVMCAGGNLLHWSPRTGRLQMEWASQTAPFDLAKVAAAGRADGKVVFATARRRVLVHDMTTGKIVAEFKGRDGNRQPRVVPPPHVYLPEWPVAVQAVGPLAASAWDDGSVDLWRIEDGKWVRTLKKGQGRVAGMAFSPDGRQLAVTYADGNLRLWDVELGQPQCPDLLGPADAKGLCYSPDGKWLVQSGREPIIAVWDLATRKRIHTLKGHGSVSGFPAGAVGLVLAVAYSPAGKWLATGGGDGAIRLWDATTYKPAVVLSAMTIRAKASDLSATPIRSETIYSLRFTADGRQLIAVQIDGTMRVYDLKPIEDMMGKAPQDLLALTEEKTGLRLQEDRPVPIQQNRLVREGEPLRTTYQQDFSEVFNRVTLIQNTFLLQGRYKEARDQLTKLLKERGVPAPAEEFGRMLLAQACMNLGELKQAKYEVQRLLTKNPNNRQARLQKAFIYSRERNYTEALEVLQEMLAEPGLLPDAEWAALGQLAGMYVFRGLRYQTTGEFGKAREDYNKADKCYDRFSQLLPPGGNLDLSKALRDQRDRLRRSIMAGHGFVHLLLGQLENDEGRPEQAIPWFKSAINKHEALWKEDPGNDGIKAMLQGNYLARASTFWRLGRFEDAASKRLGHFENAARDLDAASKLDDGRRKELFKFRRAVMMDREPGADDLANYRQAASEANALADAAALQAKAQGFNAATGSDLYDSAVLYAFFLKGCQDDRTLTPEQRKELQDQYGLRAVELLRQAKAARFFAAPSNRDMLREEKAFASLKERDDFQKVRDELKAEANAPEKER